MSSFFLIQIKMQEVSHKRCVLKLRLIDAGNEQLSVTEGIFKEFMGEGQVGGLILSDTEVIANHVIVPSRSILLCMDILVGLGLTIVCHNDIGITYIFFNIQVLLSFSNYCRYHIRFVANKLSLVDLYLIQQI